MQIANETNEPVTYTDGGGGGGGGSACNPDSPLGDLEPGEKEPNGAITVPEWVCFYRKSDKRHLATSDRIEIKGSTVKLRFSPQEGYTTRIIPQDLSAAKLVEFLRKKTPYLSWDPLLEEAAEALEEKEMAEQAEQKLHRKPLSRFWPETSACR